MESKNKIEVPLSFIKGFKLLNDYQKEECKSAIMKGLGITTDQGFGKRMRGEVEHGVIEAKIIENAFRECGVKAKDVWGS